jgi:hypothetical protein
MSDTGSIKKEISKLVAETLLELGHVDHTRMGTGPVHTGLPEIPVSSVAGDYFTEKAHTALHQMGKALENVKLVIREKQSLKEQPGDLQLIADQLQQTMDSLAEYLGYGKE